MTIETLCAKENFVKNENRVRMDRGIAGVEPDSALAAPLRHSRIRTAVDKAKEITYDPHGCSRLVQYNT